MKSIGIVICNFNKKDACLECIQSVLDNKYTDYDLYVVDNASTDGAATVIMEKYGDRLTLIQNKENLGGSGGFNTGLRIAFDKGYEYLMCIDNDALLDENAIGALHDFLENHPETGIAASKVYHLENPDLIQQYGQVIDFDYFCTEVPHLNMVEDGTMPDFLYVDAAAACSLMIRRSTIERIGFWPEDNFLYWDDTEWCYRCNQAGMKVASVGTSQVLHAMGAKKEAVNTFPTYYAWRNWIRFFIKYTPEEKWDKMADTFLSSVFNAVYAGLHKGEKNIARTVMLAYDDAIHCVTGKAGDGRIFDVDVNFEKWRKLFSVASVFYIKENGFPSLAGKIKDRAAILGAKVSFVSEKDYARSLENIQVISLCESIFAVDDLSLNEVYIDIDECILATEDDALMVINYNYSKRAFVFANKPVFMSQVKKLRK